ncbi:MAG: LexA family protein [Trebonia sp.]
MLKVAGDSMIGAAIADSDWVVVHRQPNADSGDIVAAMLESEGSADGEATVKTLKKADGHTWLIPHNPAYSPIMADRAVIIGKVVSVLRRLLRSPARLRGAEPSLPLKGPVSALLRCTFSLGMAWRARRPYGVLVDFEALLVSGLA